MRVAEFVLEAKVSVRDQILQAAKKSGGNLKDYFVRFSDVEKLGFSARQKFGRTPDVDDPKFNIDYIGAGYGKPAVWFYPLKYFLKQDDAYAMTSHYVYLVKLKPQAWLQSVTDNTQQIEPAPQGKERVGITKTSAGIPSAIFFKPGYDVVAMVQNYEVQHRRHGQVKGAPKPSFFDRVRGYQ